MLIQIFLVMMMSRPPIVPVSFSSVDVTNFDGENLSA